MKLNAVIFLCLSLVLGTIIVEWILVSDAAERTFVDRMERCQKSGLNLTACITVFDYFSKETPND